MENLHHQAAPIRVLVVDNSAFMRGVLSKKIDSDPRFTVVDTASDGRQAVTKTLALRPDVVTLDIDMPVMNGLDALKEIIRDSSARVIMVSAQTEAGAAITLEALAIGAIDFISKSRGADQLFDKIIAAANAPQSSRPVAPRPVLVTPRSQIRPAAGTGARVNAKIVVIGSSTGGPHALQAVLIQLPENLPVPVVVAQHMPPHFTKALAQRLNEACTINVVEAQDGEALMRGTVYIAPGGMQMRISQTDIRISAERGDSLYKPSVDVLAESARGAFGKAVLGVMLTGMGGDGASEFVKLHKSGAHTICQDQATSVVYGMPRTVVEQGGANEVLPLDGIGARIRSALGC